MKRKRRKSKAMVHVSFDTVEQFIPRVPQQRCINEDSTTPRICVAPDLTSALQAIPQAGEVIYNMKRIGVPVIIHAYYLQCGAVLKADEINVPDACVTGEMWLTDAPSKVYRCDFELTDSYTVLRKDKYGTEGRMLLCARYKRVKHQDNWKNLAYYVSDTEKRAEKFLKKKPDITFRTFMSNLDEELIKCMNIEPKDIEF